MINATQMPFATAKVLAVSSANVDGNMNADLITCLGERQ